MLVTSQNTRLQCTFRITMIIAKSHAFLLAIKLIYSDESCRQDVTLKVVGSRSPGYKVFVDILDTRGDEYVRAHIINNFIRIYANI